MSTMAASIIRCPICNEVMGHSIDFNEGLITLICRKCNRVAGIYKPRIRLDLYTLGMSLSIKDVAKIFKIFVSTKVIVGAV